MNPIFKLIIGFAAYAALATSLLGQHATVSVQTNRVSTSTAATINFHNSTGEVVATSYGEGSLSEVAGTASGEFRAYLPGAGTYYLSIIGDWGERFWSDAQTVTAHPTNSGVLQIGDGNLEAEAFPNQNPPYTNGAQILTGYHAITGSLEVDGPTLTLGAAPFDPDQPAVSLSADLYNLDGDVGVQFTSHITSAPLAKWQWRSGTGALAMSLSGEWGGGALYVPGGFYTDAGNVLTSEALDDLTLTNTADRKITIFQSSNASGRNLTLEAGRSEGTNKTGGKLILSAGSATGDQGSEIEFKTAVSGGSSGATFRGQQTRMKINAAGGIVAGKELLTGATNPHFVVGKYNNTNSDTTGNHAEGLFIVGNGEGTGLTPRQNAMRILENGAVLIRESGDISMGGFRAGEQP